MGLGRQFSRGHRLRVAHRMLTSPMASTHGNLVLPPPRLLPCPAIEVFRSRRAIAPPIASPLSKWAMAGSSPEASSPRCSPDAYGFGVRCFDLLICDEPDAACLSNDMGGVVGRYGAHVPSVTVRCHEGSSDF